MKRQQASPTIQQLSTEPTTHPKAQSSQSPAVTPTATTTNQTESQTSQDKDQQTSALPEKATKTENKNQPQAQMTLAQASMLEDMANEDQVIYHQMELNLAEAYLETEAAKSSKTSDADNKIAALKTKLGQLNDNIGKEYKIL